MSLLDPADIYRQEAAELLDSLEGTLLDLGQSPDDRHLVDAAFRALHTIKGSGSMFGFDAVAAFTHDFETAFDRVRQGEAAVSAALVTVALAAKDHIRTLIEQGDAADAAPGEVILAELQRLVTGAAAPEPAPRPLPATDVPAQATGWQIDIRLAADVLRNGTDPLGLLDELRALGPCTVTPEVGDLPCLDELDPQELRIGWRVVLEAACPRSAIEDVFIFVLDDMVLELAPLGSAMPSTGPDAAETAPGALRADVPPDLPAEHGPASEHGLAGERREPGRRTEDKGGSIRVQAERLDALMDRVGELVIAQARLSQLAHAEQHGALSAIAEEIERLAANLRDTTMGIRMVPIGTLFARFRRLVHDLSRDLGKPVEFVTFGEDTELDKTMIERLADPLVHLIRNAIDHGIEAPDRRAAAGKPPMGRIELRAEHVGAQVSITVRDDGAGLNTARIRSKAEEQGLIAPGGALSDAAIHEFLFHPGFSTAQTVSALSGRGVGMDVVKRTIEGLRGTIELSTTPGAGSTVALRLPLTLAIIDGLLVRVGVERYIVPLSAIEACVELPEAHAAIRQTHSFLDIRGELVPFLRLREIFAEGGQPEPHQKIIITAVGETRVGLVVDAIIGSHQTVIKSLSRLHSDVTMFSGATILGDGGAALILDVGQLMALGQVQSESDRRAA